MSATIEELQRQIEALQAEIESDVERLIKPKRKELERLESQLQSAKMEAYFTLFPEKRIAVDDEILVTDEFNQLMERRGTWGSPVGTEGKVYWIYNPEIVRVQTKGGLVTIPFDVVLRMREAWLDKEAGK
jgi:hypothetical protein